jgi:hypothetical protein
VVFGHPPVVADPGEGALRDPASGQLLEGRALRQLVQPRDQDFVSYSVVGRERCALSGRGKMKGMSSGGGTDAFYRLSAGMASKLPTPRQPTALSSATDFFAKLGKLVNSSATALEKWGKAASDVVWEVSETLWVVDELIEYHGGEHQGADIYVLALAYLQQKPDADLEDRLRRTIRQHGDQLELRRLWKLLDRHKSRESRTGPGERVERLSSRFRRSFTRLDYPCSFIRARFM